MLFLIFNGQNLTENEAKRPIIIMTCSAKTGLMAYFEALRNDRFKYLEHWNSPMVEVTSTNFTLFS